MRKKIQRNLLDLRLVSKNGTLDTRISYLKPRNLNADLLISASTHWQKSIKISTGVQFHVNSVLKAI